ncbi:MAG: hypothetical protein QM698_07420 [Micropepsaceae bacterium]
MNAIAFQQWTDGRAGAEARPQLGYWIAGSILFHALLIALVLIGPDWKPMHLADRAVQDRPAVEVVMTRLVQTTTPDPADEEVKTDRPSNALPPPVRKLDTQSDLQARPDSPLAGGLQPIDPDAVREYVKRNAPKNAPDNGLGYTWATCSMLSPERRVAEPACDGLMLQRDPDSASGLLVLMAPDKETLRAIQAYAPETPPKINPEGDAAKDRTFRNESDEYYGPRPWE